MDILNLKFFENDLFTLLTSILIALASFLVLQLFKYIMHRRVEKVAKYTITNFDDLILELFKQTKTFTIIFISIFIGAQLLLLPPQARLVLNKVIILVLLIQSAIWGSNTITFWIERYMKKRASKDMGVATTIGLISFIAKLLLYSIIFMLILSNFGINITALIAGLGVGGIAVALAAQNILGDLFASLTIVLDKPFIVGDFIIVGDYLGTIEHIGLKTTRLRSLSGEQLIFSNADLLQSRIRNYKRMNERRVVFNIKIVHQTPLDKIKLVPQIISQTIERESRTRLDRSHFNAISDYALNIETVYWVLSADYNIYMDIQQEFNLEILKRFKEEGIQLAYPTQNIFMNTIEPSDENAPRLS